MEGNVVIGMPIAFTILAASTVALRLYARTRTKSGLGWADWTMLLAVVIEIVNRGLTTVSMSYSYRVPMTPQDAVEASRYSYITVPFQISVSVLARLSITILLIRLFGIHNWFKRCVILLFCIIAVVSIAFIPLTYSQVAPLQVLWDPSTVIEKSFAPRIWIYYAATQQSLYTFSDLVLVLLPVMFIWNLQMPLHQKIGLVVIMALGLLAMVMSILRTVWIVSFYNSDLAIENRNQTVILTLAFLEGPMVIIMGCIPTLRNLIDQTFSAMPSLRKLFTKFGVGTRQKVEDPKVDNASGITGAYVDLELSARERGAVDQSGNVRVCEPTFDYRNRSEDYLVDQGQIRKTEHFSLTYGSAGEV